jgi:hypothetical protein
MILFILFAVILGLALIFKLHKNYYSKYQTIIISDFEKLATLLAYNEINKNVLTKNSNYIEFGNTDSLYTEFIHSLVLGEKKYNNCNHGSWYKKHKLGSRLYFNDDKFEMYGYITFYKSVLFGDNIDDAAYRSTVKLEIDINKSKYLFDEYYKKIDNVVNNYSDDIILCTTDFTSSAFNSFISIPTIKIELNKNNNIFPGDIHLVDGYFGDKKRNYVQKMCISHALSLNTNIKIIAANNFRPLKSDRVTIIYNLSIFDNNIEKLYLFLDLVRHTQNALLIVSVDNYKESTTKYSNLPSYVTSYIKIE